MAYPPEKNRPATLAPPIASKNVDVASQVIENKSAFMAYNIGRVRELMRYLTAKKKRLFQLIPFWLHVNVPNLPGYISNPQTPCGIYRFHESGFFKQALSLLKISAKKIRPYLPGEDVILGVYLMGSSGTLAQSGNSDFDFWVLLDVEALGASRTALLQKKLTLLETYCRDRYQQSVTFFILDKRHARANQFDALDSESAGSSHRILLKEEFYRTFIMIAGRIPYWAVLPPGLTGDEYQKWIDLSEKNRHLRFIPEDYIDLGHLPPFDHGEALGALLWQIYKARSAPAKSIIKGALILYYFFFYENEGFICDQIKERFFLGGSSGESIDPYAMLFNKALAVLESLENQEMMTLIKKSIFFRLSGYQPLAFKDDQTPKVRMLNRLVSQWQWSQDTVDHLLSFQSWPEDQKLDFEQEIFKSISYFYELVLRAQDETQASVNMVDRDLKVLTNQIDATFKSSPGKIPRCSVFLKRNIDHYQLVVFGQEGAPEGRWSVFGGAGKSSLDTESLLFKGPEILKVAGWLISNNLYHPKSGAIMFQNSLACVVEGSQIQRIVKKVHRFFHNHLAVGPSIDDSAHDAALFILIHPADAGCRGGFTKVDFLILNTWKVFVVETLTLSKIETRETACYKLAEHVWQLMKKVPGYQLEFQATVLEGSLPMDFIQTMNGYIERFKQNRAQIERLKRDAQSSRDDQWPLLLDT